MIRRSIFVLVAGIFFVSLTASAQNRFSNMHPYSPPSRIAPARPLVQSPASHVAAAPQPAVAPLPGTPALHRISAPSQSSPARGAAFSNASVTTSSFFIGGSSFDLGQLLNNVPGLGFDFSHLAALNRDFGVRAIIDPVTQHELAITEKFLQSVPAATSAFIPFYGGNYPQPVAYPQPPPPQIIVLQQPAPQLQPVVEGKPAPASALPEQPPLPPVGEFVLVLRNGKQIKAVAFTRQADSIVYITADGTRGSFPAADLDASATEHLNQQHGTPLKLSL